MTALEFSKAKDAELAWIDGCIDTSISKDDLDHKMYDDEDDMDSDKGKKENKMPALDENVL